MDDGTNLNHEEKKTNEGKDQKPIDLKGVIEALQPYVEMWAKDLSDKREYRKERARSGSIHDRKLTYSLLFFMGAIILIMAFLTYVGKVSGDALLFLAGTIVGYLMSMITGLLYNPWESEDSQDN